MQHFLIADSGATNTDWAFVENGKILKRFETEGISPIYQSEEEITDYITHNVYPKVQDEKIDAVYFYGSGCIPEKVPMVKNAFSHSLSIKTIEVYSDLVAAAHSLCGTKDGIAAILGTGSNSCEWDGNRIVKQIPALGFILGDEGSGAHLGKLLISNALKNQLPTKLKEDLLEQYKLTPANIIDRVYRQPFPSRFLASFSPFILKHINLSCIREIVEESFTDFFERNILQYDYQKKNVNFVGSIAYYFAPVLKEIALKKGIGIGNIEQSPMSGLVQYYIQLGIM